MSVTSVAMNAYRAAVAKNPGISGSSNTSASSFSKKARPTSTFDIGQTAGKTDSFEELVTKSLTKVNDLQSKKKVMIEDFASGEKQNVHELMISLQKAGLAMKMTSTVRNKVLESYKTLSQIHF